MRLELGSGLGLECRVDGHSTNFYEF